MRPYQIWNAPIVAQVSQPAVSPISKSAARGSSNTVRAFHDSRIGKSAIQPTWKSASRAARCVPFHAVGDTVERVLTKADGRVPGDSVRTCSTTSHFNHFGAGSGELF